MILLPFIAIYFRIGMAIPRIISLLKESRNQEWQNNIPRGSRNVKSIPRGPQGNLRNYMLLNLLKNCLFTTKKVTFYTNFQNFQKIPLKFQILIHILFVPIM